MPSTLQALRRQAGFATARDFADHIGVPFPTYSRYESNPDKIPIAAAWSLADRLGCTIDAVVGRATIEDVEQGRGEVQREYDALDPELRSQMDQYRSFLRYQQGHRQAAARRERERAFEQLAAHYEAAMRRELMQQAFDLGEFYAPLDDEEEARDAFRKFITDLAARKRGRKGDAADGKGDQKTIDELMAAYDRMHEWA